MSALVCLLVVVLSIEVRSRAICQEDDVLTVSDLKLLQDTSNERRGQIKRELGSSDYPENAEKEQEDAPESEIVLPDESGKLRSNMPPYNEDIEHDLKTEMENENTSDEQREIMNKGKRQICDQILEQLKSLPCDNPVVISCGGSERLYPCTSRSESPLRSALSNVDAILGAAESLPRPILPSPALMPSLLPNQISPIQTLPVNSPSMAANLLPGVGGIPSLPVRPGGPLFAPTRILTAEERRERQKGIFEGLLRFGTVVNHIDSFLTDKSKMFIRGLNRMVASEEDSRFN